MSEKSSGWLLPDAVISSLDDGLSQNGFADYDAAVVLVRILDPSSPSGFGIKGAHTGEQKVIATLLADALRRMLAVPITLEPYADEDERPRIIS